MIVAYAVGRGEPLRTIMSRDGTTVEALRRANGVCSARICPGQALIVAFND